jgi:hypothetical protein
MGDVPRMVGFIRVGRPRIVPDLESNLAYVTDTQTGDQIRRGPHQISRAEVRLSELPIPVYGNAVVIRFERTAGWSLPTGQSVSRNEIPATVPNAAVNGLTIQDDLVVLRRIHGGRIISPVPRVSRVRSHSGSGLSDCRVPPRTGSAKRQLPHDGTHTLDEFTIGAKLTLREDFAIPVRGKDVRDPAGADLHLD